MNVVDVKVKVNGLLRKDENEKVYLGSNFVSLDLKLIQFHT